VAKLDDDFARSFRPTDKSEAAHGEVWFWITLIAACVPWIAALVVWRI
jgi:hypothetical protein